MTDPESRRETYILPALFILALGLRVIGIYQGFWFDELYSLLNYVHAPLAEAVKSLETPNNHIFANLLARISIAIFGEAEWSARLPSLILGSLTVPMLYVFSRKYYSIRVSLFASLLLCFSKWNIWHSQEMRGYAGMIFCILVSQLLFLELTENFHIRRAVLYFIASLAAIYFHLYSAFVIMSQAIVFLVFRMWRKEEAGWKPIYLLAGVTAAALILYAPMLGPVFDLLNKGTGALYGKKLTYDFFYGWIREWGAGELPFFISIIMPGLFIAGFSKGALKRRAQRAVLVMPVIIILLVTWILGFYIYLRFLAFFLPFYFLFISSGIEELSGLSRRKNITFYVTAFLVFAISLPSLVQYYRFGMQGFKKAAQYVESYRSEVIVHSIGLSAEEFRYYLPEALPVKMGTDLVPARARGSLVVGSHPWSWGSFNTSFLENECRVLKSWPSGGYEENEVTLFDCGAAALKSR